LASKSTADGEHSTGGLNGTARLSYPGTKDLEVGGQPGGLEDLGEPREFEELEGLVEFEDLEELEEAGLDMARVRAAVPDIAPPEYWRPGPEPEEDVKAEAERDGLDVLSVTRGTPNDVTLSTRPLPMPAGEGIPGLGRGIPASRPARIMAFVGRPRRGLLLTAECWPLPWAPLFRDIRVGARAGRAFTDVACT